jgi:hypothetical protein
VLTALRLLADATSGSGTDVWQNSLKNVLFMAFFFLLLIGVAIWWLRR